MDTRSWRLTLTLTLALPLTLTRIGYEVVVPWQIQRNFPLCLVSNTGGNIRTGRPMKLKNRGLGRGTRMSLRMPGRGMHHGFHELITMS